MGDSFFEGDILSGPLELNSRNPSNIIETRVFNANTSTQNLYNYLNTFSRGTTNIAGFTVSNTPVNGSYNGIGFVYFAFRVEPFYANGLFCGLLDKDRNPVTIPGGITPNQTISPMANNNFFRIRNSNNTYQNLAHNVQIGFYNPQGRTFKLNNLPYNEPTMSGAIWRDASGYLRIKI